MKVSRMRMAGASLFALCLLVSTVSSAQASTASDLKGRILLRVESAGEAWYVNPSNLSRYYMGRPADAFSLMRSLGVGISNANLMKIQPADLNLRGTPDSDNDGLADVIEPSFGTFVNSADSDSDGYLDSTELVTGYDPLGPGKLPIDSTFSRANAGKIFIQVESKGEAWYVNPVDLKRYYLGRPADAFSVMRSLGLGVTNRDLSSITYAGAPVNPITPSATPNLRLVSYAVSNSRPAVGDSITITLYGQTSDAIAGINTIRLSEQDHPENILGAPVLGATAPGATWQEQYTWKCNYAGHVQFLAQADWYGQVRESNEGDNTLSFGVDCVQPTPVVTAPHWYLRLYNADDSQSAAVNNSIYLSGFNQDTGFMDITNLVHSGNNTVELHAHNNSGAYAYGFQLKKDATLVYDQHAGTAGTIGANNNDSSKPNQDVFFKTLVINENGVVSEQDHLGTPAPVLSGNDPANGSTEVAINKVISVTFSKDMDPNSITTNTFKVYGPGNSGISGSITRSGLRTYYFTPSSSLSLNTNYVVNISNNIWDSTGMPLANSYSWSFVTQQHATGAIPTPKWYVRLYNGDDTESASTADGNSAFSSSYAQDTGFIDVTTYSGIQSNINLKAHNNGGGYTYGFQVKRDDTIVFSESAGTVGTAGANSNDQTKQNQDIYNKTLVINGGTITSVINNLP